MFIMERENMKMSESNGGKKKNEDSQILKY